MGGLIGPFKAPPFVPWCHTAPLMTTIKKDSPDRRVILDLSFPDSTGVNGGITKNCIDGQYRPYTLPTIEDLVTKAHVLGRGCFLWKADLARAYRQLRTDPMDTPLLTIQHGGQYYVDVCPSFGARLSGAACQRTTLAVTYLLAKRDCWSLCYLDDFCGAAATLDAATEAYNTFMDLTSQLGLSLSAPKCQPPSQDMEWLGFRLNTLDMTLTIPKPKLQEILEECASWKKTHLANKKRVQSLSGKLSHISKCIRPARKFMYRILETIRQAPETGLVYITDAYKADVSWFLQYAALSNGLHLLEPPLSEFHLDCDSSLVGGGGNSSTHYYIMQYSEDHIRLYKPIHRLEAVNLLIAYRTLAPLDSQGVRIVITTDNLGSQLALETGRTHEPVLATCARQLWLEASLHDHVIEIRHKKGTEIPLADALSRQHEPDKRLYALSRTKQLGLHKAAPALPHPMFSLI